MLKKLIALVTVIAFALSLAGCRTKPAAEKPAEQKEQEEIKLPTRPIKIVNPWSPGGGTDVVAHQLAKDLEPILGHQVVAVNTVGGSGTVAVIKVSKAPADGYTLLINDKTFVSSYYMGVTKIKWNEMEPVCCLHAASHAMAQGRSLEDCSRIRGYGR